MSKQDDSRDNLLYGNVFKTMLSLSIPAILGMVVIGLYNFMDAVFVGRMVGPEAMTAVKVSYPFTLINSGIATLIGTGSASVLSRAIGKNDKDTIDRIMGNLVTLVLILSIIITAVGIIFTPNILSLAGAKEEILSEANRYLKVVFIGSLFVNFAQSANMVMRGEGKLKIAMIIMATGAIINIVLDPIMISLMKEGNGILGAAYATITAQIIQAVITFWYFMKKSDSVKINRIGIDSKLVKPVLGVGVSAMLMQVMSMVQQTIMYNTVERWGSGNWQTILGVALSLQAFAFIPLWGISQGFQPAVGAKGMRCISLVLFIDDLADELNRVFDSRSFDKDKIFSGVMKSESCICFPATDMLKSVFNELMHLPESYGDYHRKLLTYQVILATMDISGKKFTDQQYFSKDTENKVHKARKILGTDISADISIEDLSGRVKLNRTTLQRVFKQMYGVTIYEYRTQVRMQEAKNLLLKNKYSITEIAGMCGYSNASKFSAVFKKYTGMSPSEYL